MTLQSKAVHNQSFPYTFRGCRRNHHRNGCSSPPEHSRLYQRWGVLWLPNGSGGHIVATKERVRRSSAQMLRDPLTLRVGYIHCVKTLWCSFPLFFRLQPATVLPQASTTWMMRRPVRTLMARLRGPPSLSTMMSSRLVLPWWRHYPEPSHWRIHCPYHGGAHFNFRAWANSQGWCWLLVIIFNIWYTYYVQLISSYWTVLHTSPYLPERHSPEFSRLLRSQGLGGKRSGIWGWSSFKVDIHCSCFFPHILGNYSQPSVLYVRKMDRHSQVLSTLFLHIW